MKKLNELNCKTYLKNSRKQRLKKRINPKIKNKRGMEVTRKMILNKNQMQGMVDKLRSMCGIKH